MLTQNQLDDFNENGYLVIRSFYEVKNDIEPIQYGIYRIIGALIKREKLNIYQAPFLPETFDSGFIDLISYDRSLGGVVYDAAKQIPEFIRLASSEKHEALYRQIYSSKFPGLSHGGQGIRIDIPFEEKFRAPWHQEYLNQLRSMEGLVFWSPLLSVTQKMGPVEFCLGSHKKGVFPVRMVDTKNPEKMGAYAMTINNEDQIISSFAHAAPLTEIGDLVLAHWLVLHRSGNNSADRCRWTMQMRYFSFDNETAISNNWVGSFAAGVNIESIHPEFIIKEPC